MHAGDPALQPRPACCRRRCLPLPAAACRLYHPTPPAPCSQVVSKHSAVPEAQGLFNPQNDKDACGVGFVAGELRRQPGLDAGGGWARHSAALLPCCSAPLPPPPLRNTELSKEPKRRTVVEALEMLRRMTHRGACGCETNTGAARVPPGWAAARQPQALWIMAQQQAQAVRFVRTLPSSQPPACTCCPPLNRAARRKSPLPSTQPPSCSGDGAGILVGIPHLFLSEVAEKECGIELPPQVRAGQGGHGRWDRVRIQQTATCNRHCLRHTLRPASPHPPALPQGDYAVGQVFLPKDPILYDQAKKVIHQVGARCAAGCGGL